MKFVVSPSNDPFFNIASEEYFIKSFREKGLLVFLYINSPAVVIGRNQNPWQEVNIPYLLENEIPVVRRISGGGTVYHDEGNINISFITDRTDRNFNNYKDFTQPVINYLQKIGVPAELNKRNDIVIGVEKISGNAQFSSKNRLLSHGTLLVNANLDNLRNALKVKDFKFTSNSTGSTRSRVTSLNDYLKKELSPGEVIAGLENEFQHSFQIEELILSHETINEINVLSEKFRSFEWIYGRTQKFSIKAEEQNLEVYVEEGFVRRVIDEGVLIEMSGEPPLVPFLPYSIRDGVENLNLRRKLLSTFF